MTGTGRRIKLASIRVGAEPNAVDSVAGKTGAVTLDKGDVGLSNVDNTSDASKPVSSATQSALNAKASTSHSIDSHSDTTATGAELDELTGGGETALHSHAGGGGGGDAAIDCGNWDSGTGCDINCGSWD